MTLVSIILLHMTDGRLSANQRGIVRTRANGCCEYCLSQERVATEGFSVDHIIPRHVGGETTVENLALACQGCNAHKHTKTTVIDPESGVEVPLFHPRLHRWEEHFAWNREYTHVVGVTHIGRATVAALRLNRPGIVNLRRALRSLGEHPPDVGRAQSRNVE